MSVVLLATCLALTQARFNEIVYPLDNRGLNSALLDGMAIAIVEPVKSTMNVARLDDRRQVDYINLDTFRVVASPEFKAGSEIIAVRSHGDSYRGDYENPSLTRFSRYLLFAKQPKNGHHVIWNGTSTASFTPSVGSPNEVLGVSLIPTTKSDVPTAEHRWQTCLLSLAQAFEGSTDETARRIAALLFNHRSTWSKEEVTWRDANVGPVIRKLSPTLLPYSQVMALCVLNLWKLGTYEEFLEALIAADQSGALLDVEHDR